LPWFRFKKRKEGEQAPEVPAPAPPPKPEAAPEQPASEAGTQTPTRRRRRGSRGGRNRRPRTTATAQQQPKTQPEPKPAAPERKPAQRRQDRGRSQRARIAPRRAPLPPAKRQLLVSADVGEQRVAVLEDDRVAEVYLERPERRSIAGNIYKGKVDNVLPGMEAAFVEIGLEKNGFLYVDEIVVPELEGRGQRKIQDLLSRGQEVLVQAVKDPMKSKGARLTTEISLPGRFVVFVPSGEGLGVSRRLEDAERTRLRDILKELNPPTGGVIVRTAAEGATAEDIERDLVFLQRLWNSIQKSAEGAKAPALVYQESELPLRVIRDLFTEDFEHALVDDERTFRRIVGYLKKTSPHMVERVERYREKAPLFEQYGVDAEIRSTLSRRVDLPSGGYLVFDYAEAFTVIDVNTGRFTGSRSKTSTGRLEDTITKNNLEAVKEVVRQLRMRDIGGIIVIDFIDMANPKNRGLVEEALRTELERDRTKTYVVEISPLGLVEMTRQNVTDGPREILTERCEVCGGDGVVVSEASAAIDAERRLQALARQSRNQAFRVELNAGVASILVGPAAKRLQAIEELARRRFYIVPRKDVPLQHFTVLAQGSRAKLAPQGRIEEGSQIMVELGEIGLYDSEAGVGRLNGSVVVVGEAAKLVGKKVKVRIERVLDGVAYAALVTRAKEQQPAPITAEEEAVKPTRQPPARGRSPKPKPQPKQKEEKPAEEAAEPETETPPAEAPAAEEKPKRKTRRGSRGGRRRRKPSAAAATPSDGSADGKVPGAKIHVPEPDLSRAEAPAAEASTDGAEQPATAAPEAAGEAAGEPPKPRRRTRRGSRGGRNRRKKAAAPAPESAGDS
jgi:ribonuclease G